MAEDHPPHLEAGLPQQELQQRQQPPQVLLQLLCSSAPPCSKEGVHKRVFKWGVQNGCDEKDVFEECLQKGVFKQATSKGCLPQGVFEMCSPKERAGFEGCFCSISDVILLTGDERR